MPTATTVPTPPDATAATAARPKTRPLAEGWPPWTLLAAGLFLTVLTGPRWGIALLAWLTPVPYLVYARQARGGDAWIRLFGTLFVGHCVQCVAIATPPLPLAAVLGFGPPIALLRFAAVRLAEAVRRRRGESAGIAAFVAGTVVLDWLAYGVLELGAWAATANSQVDSLPFLQLASIAGLAGLNALMAWTASTLAMLACSERPFARVRGVAGLAAVLVACMLWSVLRLDTQAATRTVTVGAVVTAVGPDQHGLPSAETLARTTEQLFERTRVAAARGARLVVWNELATLVELDDEAPFVARARALANELGIDLMLAYGLLESRDPLLFDNKYLFIADSGAILDTYRKHHPVPGEPSIRGTGPLRVLDRPYGKVGGAICYDYDFPAMAREHARAGAELVVVPASDWRGIDPVHTLMARVRAIEGGFALVRSARWSASGAFDAQGRIRAWMPAADHEEGVMVARVPVVRTATLAAGLGDAPVALAALVLGGLLTRSVRRKREVVEEPAAQTRAHLARMVREQELAGAQYVAIQGDRIMLDAHVGVADAATNQPMERATLQMAYSITKVVTAIAVMQLAEAGKLDLDAPLSRYWPDHPYGTGVTIRTLLAHTSGVPNPMPLDWFVVAGEPLDRDAALHGILTKHGKRSADPGEAYGYSNIGYWLLERVVGAASGEDYARYVERHVFAPIGVDARAATFDLPEARALATGHARRYSPLNLLLHAMTPSRYWLSGYKQWSRAARVQPVGRGYGGLFTSAAALAGVLQDLLRPQPSLLSAQARDRMFAEQKTRDGSATGATLGWVIGELDGVRYVGKQGGGLGFHGNVRIYPQLGLATVLLANRTEVSPGPIDARSDALDSPFVAALQ